MAGPERVQWSTDVPCLRLVLVPWKTGTRQDLIDVGETLLCKSFNTKTHKHTDRSYRHMCPHNTRTHTKGHVSQKKVGAGKSKPETHWLDNKSVNNKSCTMLRYRLQRCISLYTKVCWPNLLNQRTWAQTHTHTHGNPRKPRAVEHTHRCTYTRSISSHRHSQNRTKTHLWGPGLAFRS